MKYTGGVIGKYLDQGQQIALVGGLAVANAGGSVANVIDFSKIGEVKEDDFVLVCHTLPNNTTLAPNIITDGYTSLRLDYINSTYDINFRVAYKRMGQTPDSNVTLNSANSISVGTLSGVYIFRNVDVNTPIDVTSTTANGTGNLINPVAITPVTKNSVIVVFGASAIAGTGLYTIPDLENAQSVTINESNSDGAFGMGIYSRWTSGAFDPAAWTNTNSTSTSYSYSTITIALRPQLPRGIIRSEDIYNAGLNT